MVSSPGFRRPSFLYGRPCTSPNDRLHMLKKLKALFSGGSTVHASLRVDKHGQPTIHDLQLAALVVLIEMASSDKAVAQTEAQAVCALMAKEFGIDDKLLPDLVKQAIESRKSVEKIDSFVRKLNESFSVVQRQRLLAMIWTIVLADGKVDKFEQKFAVQMYNRLQLTADQAAEARKMAESGAFDAE